MSAPFDLEALLARPLPTPIPETEGFWEGTRREELRIQVCGDCGRRQVNPGPACDECLAPSLTWTPASGRGTVFSFTVVHHAFHPAFAEKIPYVVADIELEEGPIITSNVVGIEPDQVRIGLPVAVVFEKASDEITLPVFAPRKEEP